MLSRMFILFMVVCVFSPVLQQAHGVYNSDKGRWLNRDPALYADGWNTFAYVDQNPLPQVDSHGLMSIMVNPGNIPMVPSCRFHIPPDDPFEWPTVQQACCATICANHPTAHGHVGCCEGQVVACVCANNPSWDPRMPLDIRLQLINCVAIHECHNASIYACNPGDGPETPPQVQPGFGAPESLRAICKLLFNECEAYVFTEECISKIKCWGYDYKCQLIKKRLLDQVRRNRQAICDEFKARCLRQLAPCIEE